MSIVAEERIIIESADDELERFVREGYAALVAALAVICGSRVVAEDTAQEALARAVVAGRRGRGIDNVAAWVRVVALNLLRNRWRSLGRERRAVRRVGSDLAVHAATARGPDAADVMDLERAVAELPVRQREAVALHYLLDLDVATTASAMGVTDGTVKTLLSRARAALATAIPDVDRPDEEVPDAER